MSEFFGEKPLGEIADLIMGQSPDSQYVHEGLGRGFPFLQGNAEFGDAHPHPLFSCSQPARTCRKNDVLISVRAPVGEINIADTDYCIGRGLAAIRFRAIPTPLGAKLVSKFSPSLKRVAQGTTFEAIGKNDLYSLRVLVPPEGEWAKIAQILDTLDSQIRQTEALIAKLERIKQGLLTDLLTRGIDQNGQLRPTPDQAPHLYKDSPLGRIPREWVAKEIGELPVELVDGDRGANYPSEGEFTAGEGYCLFLSAKNVTTDGFQFAWTQFVNKEKDEVLGTGRLVRGDIVVTTRGTVGNFAFFDDGVHYPRIRINSGMLIIRNRGENIASEYIYLALKERFFEIEHRKKGSGSAQPQLPARDFKTFCFAVPSHDEQLRIVRAINEYSGRLERERHLLGKLKQEKVGLMDDLLTGRVRVTPLLGTPSSSESRIWETPWPA